MERKKYYSDSESDTESDTNDNLLPMNKVYRYPPEPDEYTYVSMSTYNKALDKINILEKNVNNLYEALETYKEHYNYMITYVNYLSKKI